MLYRLTGITVIPLGDRDFGNDQMLYQLTGITPEFVIPVNWYNIQSRRRREKFLGATLWNRAEGANFFGTQNVIPVNWYNTKSVIPLNWYNTEICYTS